VGLCFQLLLCLWFVCGFRAWLVTVVTPQTTVEQRVDLVTHCCRAMVDGVGHAMTQADAVRDVRRVHLQLGAAALELRRIIRFQAELVREVGAGGPACARGPVGVLATAAQDRELVALPRLPVDVVRLILAVEDADKDGALVALLRLKAGHGRVHAGQRVQRDLLRDVRPVGLVLCADRDVVVHNHGQIRELGVERRQISSRHFAAERKEEGSGMSSACYILFIHAPLTRVSEPFNFFQDKLF
jgi:hypothetical protein